LKNAKRKPESGHKEPPPDIFHAAVTNNVDELHRALDDGQSLSAQDSFRLDMTPTHLAAGKHSNDFLEAAAKHESFNPWIRDANLRTPFDHARAFNNVDGMKILYDPMYSDLRKPKGEVVEFPGTEP